MHQTKILIRTQGFIPKLNLRKRHNMRKGGELLQGGGEVYKCTLKKVFQKTDERERPSQP